MPQGYRQSATGIRLEAETTYGVLALGGRGVLTPYTGLSVGDGEQDYRMGARLKMGTFWKLSAEGARVESDQQEAEHGLMLRSTLEW